METLSVIGSVAVSLIVVLGAVVGGIWKIGKWSSDVGNAITQNTEQSKALDAKMDAMQRALDRMEHRQESNTERISRLEHGNAQRGPWA